jgi:hypothetical protein
MGFACIVTEVCRGDDGAGAAGDDGKILGHVNQAWAFQFGYNHPFRGKRLSTYLFILYRATAF